jgi:tRNA dimethylallyltransferase
MEIRRISEMNKVLVVIAGPTAVGKTACGIEVAGHFATEIISADSRQIYQETTIGTAVPSPGELARVKHHFIQTVSVKDTYNASIFENQVLERLHELYRVHDLVLMVGGSGFYIDAVCHGIDDLPTVDPELRGELQERFRNEGLRSLTELLLRLDPVSHAKVDLKNHMRVLKALEITIQTGKPYSSFLSDTKKHRPFRILRVALDLDRDSLYKRINLRVDQMMEAGLMEEVKQVLHLRNYTAMKTVGYRELFRVLDGKLSLEEGVDLIKRNTRKYARKQLTWFRKDQDYQWFSPENCRELIPWIEKSAIYRNS